MNRDTHIQENLDVESISEEEYELQIEKKLRKCGGRFKFDTKYRCPECGSNQYDDGPDECVDFYDQVIKG